MLNKNKETKKFFGLIVVLMLLIPMILFGEEIDKKPESDPKSHADYILMIKGDHVSLKAKDASLKDILEEIGRRMNIDVIANISGEDKITIDLDMMYLEEALKKFKTNYAYITKSKTETGKITKIVVVPKGMGKSLPNKFEYNPQPSIQNSEYNHQPPIQKFEHESQPTHVESEYDPQPSIQKDEIKVKKRRVEPESRARKEVETEEPSIPEPLKSEYDPQPSIQKDK